MVANRLTVPDLTDPKTYVDEDMMPVWSQLRSADPVHWQPETLEHPGFWVVTRYADITAVLGDSANFTSESGNVLATLLAGGDAGAGRMLAVTDGQRHAELRRVLMRAFSPRVLEDIAHRVRHGVRDLLVEMTERGECDFARDVASVIPLQTICDLLAVPVADRAEVLALTKAALASDYEAPEADADRIARSAILEYFADLVAARRGSPGDDPISLMAAAEVGGRRLDDEDIILNCYSLIMGGDETSRLTMIGVVQAFIDHPDQWSALKTGAASVSSATEEALRWSTPTMHFGRTVTTATSVAGQPLSSGDLVTLWLVSGNRDERVFPDPDRFDLSRSPNKHLSLGHGTHFCLGAYLGRVEISAMLDGLRSFVSDISAAGQERQIYSNFIAGLSSLPITLTYDKKGASRWQD